MENICAMTSLLLAIAGSAITTTVFAAPISGQGTWEAMLQARDLDGNLSTAEAYYDIALNITWLANANYAGTAMTWEDANAWAAGLNLGGVTGWRLPSTFYSGSCFSGGTTPGLCGYNVDPASSEMAHLFYVALGNVAMFDSGGIFQPNHGLSNTGPFSNIQTVYWSSAMFDPFFPMAFQFFDGNQTQFQMAESLFAWGVHAGDVGASVVPVPAATWLFGSGLLGMFGVVRGRLRSTLRKRSLVYVLASMAGLVGQAAVASQIPMPAGSRVWMMLTSNACDLGDGSDCIASNHYGVNPPNGIPLSTFRESNGTYVTGAAEVLPGQLRSYLTSNSGSFMYVSMFDTYTVHGTASTLFDITVHLGATGSVNSIVNGTRELLVGGLVGVEIGNWSPSTDPAFHEQFRVNPFTPANAASQTFPTAVDVSVSYPVNVATSYTRTVGVGDVFDIAYGLNSSVTIGSIDLLHTAVISFDLPEGVYLTSALGGTFGAAAVPVPAPVWLFWSGLLGLVGVARRKQTRE